MSTREIHVYVYLPGETAAVLAGVMTSVFSGEGRLRESAQAYFRYVPSYLANPRSVAIDPFNLPLTSGRFETSPEELLLSFGAMRDAAPDSWGQSRMAREAKRQLDDVDFILASGEDRSGFLAFGLDDRGPAITAPWALNGEPQHNRLLDMDGLGFHVSDARNLKLTPEQQRLLLLYGSSLGGARPKASVKYEGKIWLAKSSRSDDQYNYPRGEHAAMTLARLSGLNVPETRVIRVMDSDVYLIERFDRRLDQNGGVVRVGFLSALSAFGISDNSMTVREMASYNGIAEKIGAAGTPDTRGDQRELYRRIIFNILVGNTDDHPRNHGFLWTDGGWRLSPLYDVQPPVYRGGSTRYLALKFGSQGGAGTLQNLLSRTADFGLSRAEALTEIASMLESFRGWREVFSAAGVSPEDMAGYEHTFAVAGELESETAEASRGTASAAGADTTHPASQHADSAVVLLRAKEAPTKGRVKVPCGHLGCQRLKLKTSKRCVHCWHHHRADF